MVAGSKWRVPAGIGVGVILATVGCSSSGSTGGAPGGTVTTVPVAQVKNAFCDDLKDLITVTDSYGLVFTDAALTVADLKNRAAQFEPANTRAKASAAELAAAIEAANAVATTPPGTVAGGAAATTTTVLAQKSADDHVAAITRAEKNLADALTGVADATPVKEVAAEVHAAAFGVEQAYIALFVDAGCLAGDRAAANAVSAYVAGLQQDLATLGFYTAAVDGIYGPQTVAAVKALQKSVGLSQSGVVDPATEAALKDALAAKGQQKALNIAGLQGALAAAGVYTGPIDGVWSPEVEAALKAYQSAQSLPPTGQIDPATLDALLNGGAPTPPPAAAPTTMAAAATTTTSAKPTTSAATG